MAVVGKVTSPLSRVLRALRDVPQLSMALREVSSTLVVLRPETDKTGKTGIKDPVPVAKGVWRWVGHSFHCCKETSSPPEENLDNSKYQVGEYYKYNTWSFYNFEQEMLKYRLQQPSSKAKAC